jgi:hypothetical protein
MPKSRKRKNARPYQAKGVGFLSIPDPAQTFWDLGSGKLSGEPGEVAASYLLNSMDSAMKSNPTMTATFPGEWPPSTTAELIDIAKRSYILERERATESQGKAVETAS